MPCETPGNHRRQTAPTGTTELPPTWLPPSGVKLYRRKSDLKDPTADEVEALLTAGQVPVLGISLPDSFLSPVPSMVDVSRWPDTRFSRSRGRRFGEGRYIAMLPGPE